MPAYSKAREVVAMRKLTAAGCILWIAGMAVFIIGMNLEGDTKEWMSVGGSIAFFIGLGITGAVWMKKQKDSPEEGSKPEADKIEKAADQ